MYGAVSFSLRESHRGPRRYRDVPAELSRSATASERSFGIIAMRDGIGTFLSYYRVTRWFRNTLSVLSRLATVSKSSGEAIAGRDCHFGSRFSLSRLAIARNGLVCVYREARLPFCQSVGPIASRAGSFFPASFLTIIYIIM